MWQIILNKKIEACCKKMHGKFGGMTEICYLCKQKERINKFIITLCVE